MQHSYFIDGGTEAHRGYPKSHGVVIQTERTRSWSPKSLSRLCHSSKFPSAISMVGDKSEFSRKKRVEEAQWWLVKSLIIDSMTPKKHWKSTYLKGASVVTQCFWRVMVSRISQQTTGIFYPSFSVLQKIMVFLHLDCGLWKRGGTKLGLTDGSTWVEWFLNEEFVVVVVVVVVTVVHEA